MLIPCLQIAKGQVVSLRNGNTLELIADTDPLALAREYVAVDPVYFEGEYVGSDRIEPADLPYGPDDCVELTFVDFSVEGQ